MPRIIVEIEWWDASGSHGWFERVEDDLLVRCHTVGYLLRVTSDAVIVTRGYNESDGHMDPLAIPRGNVISARKLV